MPGCSNAVSVVVLWLLERDPGHSVFAAPSRHCASLRECSWYILYIIVTPYYMFRLVSLAYYPVVLSAFIWHACDSLLESFPARQWDETIALDGEERQTNACYNLTQILFSTDVACSPVGATIACIDLQFPSPVGSNTQNYPVLWILPYLVSDSEDNRPNSICNNTRDATINSEF